MKLVIVESPYADDVDANIDYARAAVRDSLARGEAPIASHLLYTQPGILDDDIPSERQWGIDAGLAWRAVAEATVVYLDRGISKGMEYGIGAAKAAGLPVEYRSLPAATPSDSKKQMTDISHEDWIIACAAWNNVTPDQMRAMCEKDERRMPSGSRAAWGRVFEAVAARISSINERYRQKYASVNGASKDG